jgi:hypothetical protein
MPERLSISFDGAGPATIALERGTTIRGALRHLDADGKVDQVPDEGPDRELSPEAARFIEAYEPVEPGPCALAVFWRYHSLRAEEFETVEEAERYLDFGAEWDYLVGEAIVAPDGSVTVRP